MSKNEEVSFNFWPSYGDLAISILFILILYLVLQQITFYLTDAFKLEKIKTYQTEFIKDLKNDLKNDSTIISNIERRDRIQIISFKESFLFADGKWNFKNQKSEQLIRVIAKTLIQYVRQQKLAKITVEGHTNSLIYLKDPFGNWVLSANRAVTVVKILDAENVRGEFYKARRNTQTTPSRSLSIAGYSQYDFVPDKKNEENKEASRRIQFSLDYKLTDEN